MANNFNELLLQTLKEISVRLDRLEGRVDHVIDNKVDKTDLNATNERLITLDAKTNERFDTLDAKTNERFDALDAKTNERFDALDAKINNLSQRMDRLDGGIGTLKWIIGAEVAVIGVILAFIKAC